MRSYYRLCTTGDNVAICCLAFYLFPDCILQGKYFKGYLLLAGYLLHASHSPLFADGAALEVATELSTASASADHASHHVSDADIPTPSPSTLRCN